MKISEHPKYIETRDRIAASRTRQAGHTPGPWALKTNETYTVRAPDDGSICQLKWLRGAQGLSGRRSDDEVMANARLIAAAPDMLAALRASEREYDNLEDSAPADAGCIECTAGTVPNSLNTGLCAHHLRRAALAKATGAP